MFKDVLQGKPLRHPVHPMLVHFPIGLFFFSFLLDVASFIFPSENLLVQSAFYSMALGVMTALLAAIPGLVDYTDIRSDHPAKKTAIGHMLLNFAALGLYAINLGLRYASFDAPRTPFFPFVLSLAGVGILSVSGYLGGKLVYDEGVGIGRHRRRSPTPEKTRHFSTAGLKPKPPSDGSNTLFIPIADIKELEETETLRVEIDREIVTIVKLNGAVYAFQEFCTHRYGPLSEGSFHNGQVECPWHRSCFDVRTGKVTKGPAKTDLKTYPVELQNGRISIGVPRQTDGTSPPA